MAKKQKVASIDFQTGIGTIIPATQESFREGFDAQTRKEEKESLITFRQTLGEKLDTQLSKDDQFPTDREVFVNIIQNFVAQKEYARRDIDNMAKTILDVFKGRFYRDDSQVKTLLVSKRMDGRIPINFAYVAVTEVKDSKDVEAIKVSGLERSVTYYHELRSQGKI